MDAVVKVDVSSWCDERYRVYPNPPEPWQIIHDFNDPDIHP